MRCISMNYAYQRAECRSALRSGGSTAPPGADVERTTWGISVNKPNVENSRGSCWKKREMKWANWPYGAGERTDGNGHFPPFAALLQKGQFVLSPARYVRSYAPARKVLRQGANGPGCR